MRMSVQGFCFLFLSFPFFGGKKNELGLFLDDIAENAGNHCSCRCSHRYHRHIYHSCRPASAPGHRAFFFFFGFLVSKPPRPLQLLSFAGVAMTDRWSFRLDFIVKPEWLQAPLIEDVWCVVRAAWCVRGTWCVVRAACFALSFSLPSPCSHSWAETKPLL